VGAVQSRGPYRRLAVFLTVLGVAAAFVPQAVADDGPVAVPAAAADALALAEAVLTPTPPAETEATASTSQEDVEEAAPEAAEPTLPDVDEVVAELTKPLKGPDAQAPAPEAHSAPATSAESPAVRSEAPAAAPEAPAPAPEAPVQAAQEPANPDPTSIPAPVAEAVSAVAQQVQPLNVNISLRFESPGDNGPVSQLNAAVADVVAQFAPAPQPGTQYQPTESQYHAPSQPAASAPAPETPPATENQAQPGSEPEEQWDWTWQWNCGDAIPPEIAIPGNSLLPIWNWNWEWNCGGNPGSGGNSGTQLPSQYHAAATQYQPININISIRVLSPGNDGPVTQTNMAQANVGVTIHGSPVFSVPIVTPVSVTPPASSGPASREITSPASAPLAPFASVVETFVELATELGVLPVAIAVDLDCCVARATVPRRLAVDDGGARRPEITGMLGTADDDSGGGPTRGDTAGASTGAAPVAPVSAEAIASLAPPQPAVEAAKRARAQEQLKQPQKAVPKDERATALGHAGLSPLAAPDKSSKLFFLYMIPFAFALVDAARRVLGEQTPTAADPGRPEGRPG
jgi:hypothetical protein